VKLTHIVDDDVADVLHQADLGCCIFWLRNPPVIGGGRHGRDVVMFLLAMEQKNERD
jgi:hypothetical protein